MMYSSIKIFYTFQRLFKPNSLATITMIYLLAILVLIKLAN